MALIERPTPNQSYLVKAMQYKIAACLACLMVSLGTKGRWDRAQPQKQPQKFLHGGDQWSKDNQVWKLRGGIKNDSFGGQVVFTNTRWGPDSDINYGTKNLDQQVFESVPDKTKLIKNGTDSPLHVAYEEEVGLVNSFGTSITKGVNLDMSANLTSETKVSGEYAGVSAEETLTASLGVSKSSSKEETKDESEEGSHSETLGIEFDAQPHRNNLIEVSYENSGYSQPFEIDGIQDFDIELQFHRGGHSVKVEGIDGLVQYLFGYDTAAPWMAGWWDKAPQQVKAAMDWAQQPENRRIQVSGIKHESLDEKPTYNVDELGNDIPDEYKHLPVEDARQYIEGA